MKELPNNTYFSLLLALIYVCIVCACRNDSAPQDSAAPTRAATTGPATAARDVRIVSLSPAISRTLVDLRLQDRIVGRTPHCKALDQNIPVVGDLNNVNYEQLVRRNPTHIVIQPPAAGMDQHLVELAKEKGWKIAQWQLNGIDDIETMVREIPGALFADGTPEFTAATANAAEILNNIAAALSPGDKPLFRGPTLIAYEVYPVRVFGRHTYLSDVLSALGGTNVVDEEGWIELTLEDVVRRNPQAILILKPGATKNLNVSHAAEPFWNLEIDAISNRLVDTLVDPDSFLPSSAIVNVAQEMRESLRKFEQRKP